MCWRSPRDNIEHLVPRPNQNDRVHFDLNDYVSLQTAVNQAQPDYVFHLPVQCHPTTSFTAPLPISARCSAFTHKFG